MTVRSLTASAQLRRDLSHPIVDADGHLIELTPVLLDYIERAGGRELAREYEERVVGPFVRHAPDAERRDKWIMKQPWWGFPTKSSLDRITVSLPRLLYERLDEMGLDFAVLYPSNSMGIELLRSAPSAELRQAAYRGYNMYVAELFGNSSYSDRMTPVAYIPMHTPEEAIGELEYGVGTLGLKAVLMNSYVRRHVPYVEREFPGASDYAVRMDTYGLDSAYDYDPVWAKCVELKLSPTFHSQGRGWGWGSRCSPTNFSYNHIGHFASSAEAVCKSLFIGGVTRRFPSLRFGMLEGGVGWAVSLYADLIGHWKKRNPRALEEYVDPANLDLDVLNRLAAEYGEGAISAKLPEIASLFSRIKTAPIRPENIDDFSACGIEKAEDIRALFADRFFFGCEADDPTNALAVDERINAFGARLKVVLGSDIGHFDVPDMTGVLTEAYELVERGLFTEDDFADFSFRNPVRLYANLNRDFFKGTRVEVQVADLLT